jgi:glycosyltransferase involved in cell wall biosynthesis
MKIAFVVQRYGLEVHGGSESLCAAIAERMKKYFQVEVLTTCAVDYLTWKDYYPPGPTEIKGVPVRRFSTHSPRDMNRFNTFVRKRIANRQPSLPDQIKWMWLQGPLTFDLIRYLKESREQYDLFIFFTYSYFTTYLGIQIVPDKSLLVPTAHDEPHLYFDIFKPIFHLPRAIIYNTEEEKHLVQQVFGNTHIPSEVIGSGISEMETADADISDTPSLTDPYILYLGRIDVMKGCKELVDYFIRYVEETGRNIKLVLAGNNFMQIPKHPQISHVGYVGQRAKYKLMEQARVLVNPSEYESLSLSVLESWSVGTPVLVNGCSSVLVGHCLRSQGGLYYTNYGEFSLCLDLLLSQPELRVKMGECGRRYVRTNYAWDTVEEKYLKLMMAVKNQEVVDRGL